MNLSIEAVIFDLGGVVIASPMQTFADHESRNGLPANFINRMIVDNGAASAWGRLERGEIPMGAAFFADFDTELRAAGAPESLSSAAIFADVAGAAGIHQNMVVAIAKLRAEGFKLAALTNNWHNEDRPDANTQVKDLFDVFVESAVEGVRKPDPRIYQIALQRLGIEPGAALFLDDIGQNLKSARALGLTTIKVTDPALAIVEMETLLGLDLQ